MEDKKDKSERLRYLNEEKEKQEKRRAFYIDQINNLKDWIKSNQKEIKYNEGWINFHKNSEEKHKEKIKQTAILDEKIEQENKLDFHIKEIKNHHEEYINFHKREIDFINEEIKFFEKGIDKCQKQLDFLNEKIEENLN